MVKPKYQQLVQILTNRNYAMKITLCLKPYGRELKQLMLLITSWRNIFYKNIKIPFLIHQKIKGIS